jgi:outer membrane protein assembly factor BamD (BamD/ComL family)
LLVCNESDNGYNERGAGNRKAEVAVLEGQKRFLMMLVLIQWMPVCQLMASGAVTEGKISGEAQIWHLEKGRDWQTLSAEGEGRYLLAVAEIKRLVDEGKKEKVLKAYDKLKKDFPEIAAPDLEAFMKAELRVCEGNFVRAIMRYDKFLAEYPESQLCEAALEREYSIGRAYLAGRKKPVLKFFKIRGYAEGEKIMERITERVGDAPIGIKAAVSVAESLEERGKFEDAFNKWSEISSRWPAGEVGSEALLAMARCKYAAYRGPEYDASSLISARSYYVKFQSRYPKEAAELGVEGRISEITEQLAYKQFYTGVYYDAAGDKGAANLYYQMVIDGWPASVAAKRAKAAMKSDGLRGEKEQEWKKEIIKRLEKLFL